MAFNIPDLAGAAFPDQALWLSTYSQMLAAAHERIGVTSGCAVTAQGSPDMTVAVAAGTGTVRGVVVNVTAGNVTITAAHGTNPRIDLVVVNNAGTESASAGTPVATPGVPLLPALPADSFALAAIYVPGADTDIDANQITDLRFILPMDEYGPLRMYARDTFR